MAPSLRRRFLSALAWVIPSVTFVLMPKCPACLAVYIAAATGVGISFTTASYVRTAAIVVCLAVILTDLLVHFGRLCSQIVKSWDG